MRFQKNSSFIRKFVLINFAMVLVFSGTTQGVFAQSEPLDWTQIMKGLLTRGRTKETSTLEAREQYMISVISKRGLSFEYNIRVEKLVKEVGAGDALISALKTARQYPPKEVTNPVTAEDYFKVSTGCGDRNYDCQIDYLNRALKLNPQYADAYSRRGTIYFVMNQPDLASKDLLLTVKLSPNFAFNRLIYGVFLLDRKDYSEAVGEFTKAIEINQRYASAYHFRGIAYESLSSFGQAVADFTEAIKYDSTDTKSYIKRGQIYARNRNYQTAIADFTRAIELDPRNAESYRERSKAFESNGEKEKALKDRQAANGL